MSELMPNLSEYVDVGGPAQSLLVLDGVEKRFPIKGKLFSREKKFVHAVNGVSFSVKKGETLGVVGESGCGKSTLAKLIASLLTPDRGSLIFDGQGIDELRGISLKNLRKNLQMVFQDSYASLNPRLTILETIAYGPQVHGMSKEDAGALGRQLLSRVGLEPNQYAACYPKELSGGQRQRVNIARSLAFNPRLMILDEAVAALDKSVQAQVLNLLQDLKAERDLTYIFISHDLQVVHYISDRVMVMYLGEVVEFGPVDQIFEKTAHPYTKALFSATPSLDPDKRTEKPPLQGDLPSPIDLPEGCHFRDRCPHAWEACAVKPSLMRLVDSGDHWVACHLYHDKCPEGAGHP
jgi:peptide/nickel transport system ATP-binding protein